MAGVIFNGRRITHPGAYSADDASGTVTVSPGSINIPILVGTADAGQSGQVLWFNDAGTLANTLKGGDLVTAANLVFSPSPEGGGGASTVGVLITNSTTQATLTTGGVTYTANEYGEGGNRIQIKHEDGTIAGTKRVTVFRWDTDEMETYDNLGAIFSIQYTGTQAYADVQVTQANGVATLLQTRVGTDSASATIDISVDLTNPRFATVQDVVNYINSVSNYNVTYVDYSANGSLPTSQLDVLAQTNIKTAPVYVMAVKGDIALHINTFSSLVTVDVTGPVTNFAYTYLTGGSKGTAPNSWADSFDIVKKQFSDILIVLSSSESIHAEALTHVQQMEQRNQKQMLFTGGALGESASFVKQRAAALNSSRAVLAYPGIYHKSVNAGKTPLAPYFTAAMIAGRVCGVDPSQPVTFEYFNLVALEQDLLEGDPIIDDLISSGVAVLERVQNGAIRLVQGVTTYLGSDNPLYKEISVRRGSDKVSDNMRRAMEDAFVGKKGLRVTPSAVNTKAVDVLEQAIKDGDITAYQNIVVRFVGSLVYVDYEVAQVEPINFVLITSHFVRDDFSNQQQQQ